MNREIEVKFRLGSAEAFRALLDDLAHILGNEVKQHDVVYGPPGAQGSEPDYNWLRIRTENDAKYIFTLKKSVSGDLDSIEHETEVCDADEMLAVFRELGYELYSDLTKHRRKGRIRDIEICLDHVPGLGYFIEAEKMVDVSANVAEVEQELISLLLSHGVDTSDRVTIGYDQLERAARGK